MSIKNNSDCSSCGYPLGLEYEGQVEECPHCSSINQAISEGVTIPTPLFIGIIAFVAGMFLGPAIISSTAEGQKWVERQARGG